MDDLRGRFASLDRIPVADLWSDIDRRVSDAAAASRVQGQVTWRSGRGPYRIRREPRGRPRPSMSAQAAAVGLVLVLVVGGLAIWVGGNSTMVPPGGSPSPTASPTASPLAPSTSTSGATPTPVAGILHGWPSTTENPPGLYSWTGSGGNSTHLEGFMHNCYGSCNVDIVMGVVRGEIAMPDDATEVTVAGHEAIYRRIEPGRGEWAVDLGFPGDPTDDLWEEWIVDIDGTTIGIRLRAESGASQTDLAEARGIIQSMRYEPRSSDPYGFRIIFTITTDDWDSG